MDKKRVRFKFKKYYIIGVIILFLIIIGGTYAFLYYKYENSVAIKGNVIAMDADLKVELVAGNNKKDKKLVPLKDGNLSDAINGGGSNKGACIDSNGNLSCQVYKITLTNNGSRLQGLVGTIELYAKGKDSTYTNLKWRKLTNPTTVKDGSVINGMEKSTLIDNFTLDSGEKIVYYIAVYVQKIDGNQVNSDKGEFEGTVTFEATGEDTGVSGNLNDIIKTDAVLDTDIDFSEISSDTNGKGVYIRSGTESNSNPIYYYRGDVDNNNLIFADTCWKIVRTTEAGGTKLIYNGVPDKIGTCDNTRSDSQIEIETKTFNSIYGSPAYVGYMYGTVYPINAKIMNSVTDTYYYGNDVIYSNGTYTLTDTISSSSWSSIYDGGLNNNHYTCMGGTTCSTVYYIYYTGSNAMYYIELTGGKTVSDALSDMLDNNTTSSTIKGNSTTSGTIDYWYYNNIEQKGYSDYLEDTIWCNNRSIYQLNGWDPDGGNTRRYLYFNSYESAYNTYIPSLSCSREVDRFTVSEENGNGDLDYPVGLLTADEIMLAGGNYETSNSSYYLCTGLSWWVGTPDVFIDYCGGGLIVHPLGKLTGNRVTIANGVRPSISLKPETEIIDGDGTVNSPYIVKTN